MTPFGVGGVKPDELLWPSLFLFASIGRSKWDAGGAGPYYAIIVPPELRGIEKQYQSRWVEITARFEHPYAQQLRGTGPADIRPSRARAIEWCRSALVLTSIRARRDRCSGSGDQGRPCPCAGDQTLGAMRSS